MTGALADRVACGHSATRSDKSPHHNETYTAAQSTSVSKIPRLHSRSVRYDFRNGRSLRPSSSNLIRSTKRDSDGFLKLESLSYFETPSPNEIVGEKGGSKPSDKKRQKAAMNLSQFVALTCRLLSPFPPAVIHTAMALV
jgi:hypothetical protein